MLHADPGRRQRARSGQRILAGSRPPTACHTHAERGQRPISAGPPLDCLLSPSSITGSRRGYARGSRFARSRGMMEGRYATTRTQSLSTSPLAT
jgi:hypothetical protein